MLNNSTKTENRKKFICSECGISLSSSYNLRVHIETRCSTEKNHVCDICHSRFLTVHSLKTHIKSIHNESKKFVCSHCGKKFASKGQLTVHERSHNKEKPFVCGICNKGFSHRETLVTHSTIHTNIKPYVCENCNQTFSCVGNLIKHRKIRPDTCGLPIFTNKKICKRAGVKCVKGKGHVVVVTPDQNSQADDTAKDEIISEDRVAVQEIPNNDHQYIVIEEAQNDVSMKSLNEFTKKEIEILDFMSFDVRNVQESEYIENKMSLQESEIIVEELAEVVNEENVVYLEENFDETLETIDEFVENAPSEDNIIDEEDEIYQYIAIEKDEYQCKLCPKIYTKKNISIKHLKKEHHIIINSFIYDNANRYRKPQKIQSFKCEFCPKKYTSSKMVMRHVRVHGADGSLIHKCSCCSLYFCTIQEMENHQYSMHSSRLICDVENCQKRFDHPEKLLSHRKYAHSDKKCQSKKYTFVCSTCGRSFNTKVALSDHQRSNCGKNPIYKCQFCDKFYHSAGSLKVHITMHSSELNFSCTFCPKKFRTKGQLTVHNRRHLSIKPYKCKFQNCTAEFAHRESLLTHHTIHTGIKRFECEKCLARFSCISNLLAHRRNSRKDCSGSKIIKIKDSETNLNCG